MNVKSVFPMTGSQKLLVAVYDNPASMYFT